MKIIAFYLPQFHTFPENDKWWGKGFTEWTNTKKAKPQFKGHYQPHVPKDENYYNLLDKNTLKKQVNMSKEYNIYVFCFYHYWFKNGKKLMEKPVENFLQNKDIDINFCLSWANESWTRAWDGGNKEVLIEQEYGNSEEWKKHFYYLLPFFKDERYIKNDDKPILLIYRPEIIPQIDEMIGLWQKLAKENGLNGIYFISQGANYCAQKYILNTNDRFDAYIMYEPGFTYNLMLKSFAWKYYKRDIKLFFQNVWRWKKYLLKKIEIKLFSVFKIKILDKCDSEIIWNEIIIREKKKNFFPGAFATWDNSARKGKNARIVTNFSKENYYKFINTLVKKYSHETEFLFFTAWNEWAEGSHLEPDEENGYVYMQGISEAIKSEDVNNICDMQKE